MRVRFIKTIGGYKIGEIHDINGVYARELLKKGIVIISKDVTKPEIKTKEVIDGHIS